MGLFKDIANNFSADARGGNGTEFHHTNTENVKSNQLEASIERLMYGEYLKGITNNGINYLKTGYEDDFSQVLVKMTRQSTTHAGILQKKAKMVSGIKAKYNTGSVKGKAKATEVDIFLKNAAGSGINIHSQMKHAAYQYQLNGGFALLVEYNESHTKILSIKSLDAKEFRRETDINGVPKEGFVVRRTFGYRAESLPNNDARRVSAYNKFSDKSEQLLYVMNPNSGQPYYGIPDYIAAYNFIAADFEFGQQIYSSAANGFMPKVMATFFGRNMDKDSKRREAQNFEKSFLGSKSKPVIVSWIKKPEEKPEIDILDVNNLDKTLDVMSRLNDQKILTAHNVTSPTLFGVQVGGKLGGTGNEMIAAYQIFRSTETMPDREVLLNSFNTIIQSIGYGIEIDVEEEMIDLGTMNGAGSGERNDINREENKDD
jgi:hypothetical protein